MDREIVKERLRRAYGRTVSGAESWVDYAFAHNLNGPQMLPPGSIRPGDLVETCGVSYIAGTWQRSPLPFDQANEPDGYWNLFVLTPDAQDRVIGSRAPAHDVRLVRPLEGD